MVAVIEQTLRAAGLYTDPSELSDVPDGALLEAKNVRIRRAGVIEPRVSFTAVEAAWGEPFGRSVQMFHWDGETLSVRDSSGTTHLEFEDGTEVVDSASASLDFDARYAYADAAAGALYITGSDAVWRLDNSTPGVVARTAGAGTPGPLKASQYVQDASAPTGDQFVVYRAVLAKDINGRLVLSAPSSTAIGDSYSTGYSRTQVEVVLPADAIAGDVIQLYRSEPQATRAALDDELYLTATYTLVSGDISAGTATVPDTAGPDERGASLYTNETQEGINQGNRPPPIAKTLRWFNQMMFFGRMSDPTFTIEATTTRGYDGWRPQTAGTTTSGSPTITGVNTAFTFFELAVGQVVTGTGIPADTTVASFTPGGTTITLSQNATASGAITLTVLNFIEVDSVKFYAGAQTGPTTSGGGLHFFGDNFDGLDWLIDEQTTVHAEMAATVDGSSMALTLTRATTFNASTSLDRLMDNLSTSATASAAALDEPHRLMFSKVGQPGAVPTLNFVDIGEKGAPIQRVASTRDSLFVFKTDGVWRVTGDTPETLRVDEFNQTMRLVHPRALAEMDDAVYCWTNEGIVSLSEAGIARLSQPAIEVDLDPVQAALLADDTYTGGIFAAAHQSDDLVVFGVPDSALANEYSEWIYGFESKTSSWVRWQIAVGEHTTSAAVYESDVDGLAFSGENGTGDADLMRENASAPSDFFAYNVTIAAISGNVVTVTHGAGQDPLIGALLAQGGTESWVVAEPEVVTATSARLTVEDATGFTTASATVLNGNPTDVQWAAKTAGAPAVTKLYRDFSLLFGSWGTNTRVRCKFQTDLVATEGEITHATAAETNRVRDLRGCVTRAHMRASRLRPRMLVDQTGQDWALDGVTLAFEQQRGGERQV